MRFRLLPKSTIMDDLDGPLRTLFQNTCGMLLAIACEFLVYITFAIYYHTAADNVHSELAQHRTRNERYT